MKKYLATCLILLISISGFSQGSEKAKKYLEEVSNNVKSYKNISIDFKYSLTNEAENIEQSYKGTVYLKKEQYQLNLLGVTFFREGYIYKWDKKLPIKGRSIQYVKLIPIDTNSENKHILIGIDSNTKNIYNTIHTGKNGSVTTLTVNSFKTNQPISESLFIFDKNKYNDYYFNE